MRKVEAEYWKGEFENASNSKEFWKLVKKVQKETKSTKIGPLEDDQGNIQTNKMEKANLMNNYFATVGAQRAKAFPIHIEREQYIVRAIPSIQEIKIDDKLLESQLKR